MKKALFLALAGGLMMATSAFTTSADAGYGHKRSYHSYGHSYHKVYTPYRYVYRHYYAPVYYKPACKWVFHYGHYKKVCW